MLAQSNDAELRGFGIAGEHRPAIAGFEVYGGTRQGAFQGRIGEIGEVRGDGFEGCMGIYS